MTRRRVDAQGLREWRDSPGLDPVLRLGASGLLARMPDAGWAERADRNEVRIWRAAATPLAHRGWEARGRTVAKRGPTGYLVVIRAEAPTRGNPMLYAVEAGAASQVIARACERLDLNGVVDLWRPRPWRGPPVDWGVLAPYVALYFFGQMFLWWPLWDVARAAWLAFGVLFVVNTGLNLRGHAEAGSRQQR